MTLRLPSDAGGVVTQEVGYLHAPPDVVAPWLHEGLAGPWRSRAARFASLDDAIECLAPSERITRYVAIPVDSWTLILNDAPRGTDVGLLPSQFAREQGRRAVRAVCADDGAPAPARILEVYGPAGRGPLRVERTIAAARDGARWVFETSGEPFGFERPAAYRRRRKADRFTRDLLYEYLRALGVPFDTEPRWSAAVLIERPES